MVEIARRRVVARHVNHMAVINAHASRQRSITSDDPATAHTPMKNEQSAQRQGGEEKVSPTRPKANKREIVAIGWTIATMHHQILRSDAPKQPMAALPDPRRM